MGASVSRTSLGTGARGGVGADVAERTSRAQRLWSILGPVQIIIIALVLATAFIHLNKALSVGGMGGHHLPPHAGSAAASGAGAAHNPGSPSGVTGRGRAMGAPMALPLPLPVLFWLNFLGYLVLGAALYLPRLLPSSRPVTLLLRYQRVIRWALIGFVALTIYAYFKIMGSAPNSLGHIDKAIEITLIVALLVEDQWARVSHGLRAAADWLRWRFEPGYAERQLALQRAELALSRTPTNARRTPRPAVTSRRERTRHARRD